ncbi:hypothetical protein C2845_PM07G06550 [Panicum miliaceum]|uniref:Uncharacterized protein n=1 Tax=Panicum miliaceum TaxID=4540 RepID=A0A3L6SPR4_PANMI|nr:hypothetical protein C2845_PM07G06550 [Panicum miliaceum]
MGVAAGVEAWPRRRPREEPRRRPARGGPCSPGICLGIRRCAAPIRAWKGRVGTARGHARTRRPVLPQPPPRLAGIRPAPPPPAAGIRDGAEGAGAPLVLSPAARYSPPLASHATARPAPAGAAARSPCPLSCLGLLARLELDPELVDGGQRLHHVLLDPCPAAPAPRGPDRRAPRRREGRGVGSAGREQGRRCGERRPREKMDGGGVGGGKKEKKSDVWVPWLVVDIEKKYKGWMGTGELDIDERMSMSKTEYLF